MDNSGVLTDDTLVLPLTGTPTRRKDFVETHDWTDFQKVHGLTKNITFQVSKKEKGVQYGKFFNLNKMETCSIFAKSGFKVNKDFPVMVGLNEELGYWVFQDTNATGFVLELS